MREKLIKLLTQADSECFNRECEDCEYKGPSNCDSILYADYLIKNGVKIPTICKNCKDYQPAIFNGEPTHHGICTNTHDNVPLLILRYRYEGDSCSYGIPKESEE